MIRRASARVAGGFTLVEVLLAIAIGAIILGGVSSTLFSLASADEKVGEIAARDRVGRKLSFRIRREIEFLLRRHPSGGILGTDSGGSDELVIRTAAYGGPMNVKYFWKDGSLWREAASETRLSASEPAIVPGVTRFNVRYLGEKDWEESWTGVAPPRAVSILVTVDGVDYGSVIAP